MSAIKTTDEQAIVGELEGLLHSAVSVKLCVRTRGREKGVALRSLRSKRVLFECRVGDTRGLELAVLCAERYCVERGWVLVSPAANDNSTGALAG